MRLYAFYLVVMVAIVLVQKNSKPAEFIKLKLPSFGQQSTHGEIFPVVKLAAPRYGTICTAFIIDVNYALTAGHCVERNPTDVYRLRTAKEEDLDTPVKVVGYRSDWDAALLKGDFDKFMSVETDFYSLNVHSDKMACGYPFAQKRLSCVKLKPSVNNLFDLGNIGMLIPGMSGGPMFDEKTGKVVGINVSVGDGRVYAVPLLGLLGMFGVEGD